MPHHQQTFLEFTFVYFSYLQFQKARSFALTDAFIVAKFRHSDPIAILQCFGCQTPMKCIQCQGVPYGPMQGSILLLCSNVMFLHNKCPTRPQYPCIQSLHICTVVTHLCIPVSLSTVTTLYSFQHSVMHCSTADCILVEV